jgi:hypothetical protein
MGVSVAGVGGAPEAVLGPPARAVAGAPQSGKREVALLLDLGVGENRAEREVGEERDPLRQIVGGHCEAEAQKLAINRKI